MSVTVVALMIPYLTGQIVAFALTARTFPPGVILWLEYFTLGAFVTLLTAALGWTVGKIFGSVFAAMAAVLTCVILIGLLDRWLGSIVVTGEPEVTVAPAALILRLALVVALLATLIWIAPSGVVSARSLLAPALAMFLLLMTMSNTAIVANRQPAGAHVSCTDGAMKLCAWPEHRKYGQN